MNFSKRLKNIIKSRWTWFTVCLIGIFIVFSNVAIIESTKDNIYSSTDGIPKKDIALILGTSRYTTRGTTNLFFKYRINAAVALYKSGKIKHIIVSGDNSLQSYNEPREMRKALMTMGIPESVITLDYAGFRTLDSVVRCKEIFGQSSVTIISQRFHLQRALFIARKYKMEAIGLAAQDPPEKYSIKTHFREYFAKAKAVIDLYIINKKPKFLGKKEQIKI
jgi:SanA protein